MQYFSFSRDSCFHAFLHVSLEKCSPNHLQEFDFIFAIILALSAANLIYSCREVSPKCCINQFEHVIRYIVLHELYVT